VWSKNDFHREIDQHLTNLFCEIAARVDGKAKSLGIAARRDGASGRGG